MKKFLFLLWVTMLQIQSAVAQSDTSQVVPNNTESAPTYETKDFILMGSMITLIVAAALLNRFIRKRQKKRLSDTKGQGEKSGIDTGL